MEVYVGKYVKIKSLEWFNANEHNGDILSDGIDFWDWMAEKYCSNIYQIDRIEGRYNHIIRLKDIRELIFSKEFFEVVKKCHPTTIGIFISKILEQRENSFVCTEQKAELDDIYCSENMDDRTFEQHLSLKWLQDGFRLLDSVFENFEFFN